MLLFQTLLEILKEQYNLSNFCFLTKEKRSFRMMVLVCYYQLQEEIRQQYQKKCQFQLLNDIISSVCPDRRKKLWDLASRRHLKVQKSACTKWSADNQLCQLFPPGLLYRALIQLSPRYAYGISQLFGSY
jgi:hypothetical protein